jgi:hypothetical protein
LRVPRAGIPIPPLVRCGRWQRLVEYAFNDGRKHVTHTLSGQLGMHPRERGLLKSTAQVLIGEGEVEKEWKRGERGRYVVFSGN